MTAFWEPLTAAMGASTSRSRTCDVNGQAITISSLGLATVTANVTSNGVVANDIVAVTINADDVTNSQ